jgi:hypothetical protein
MSKNSNQTGTWVLVFVVGISALPMAFYALRMYMKATATHMHPEAESAPSVNHSDPSRTWADAVEHGRQIMRAGLAEQNLPGLSVAVGVGGDIVWAEGRLGGFREPGARHAEYSVQDRNRFQGAHLGRGRPAVGGGSAEAGRGDSDLRP